MPLPPVRLTLANQQLAYQNMVIRLTTGECSFAGTVDLTGDLRLRLTLPLDRYGPSAPLGSTTVSLPLRGTTTQPALDTSPLSTIH